jgi:hypothetical protein
MQACCFCMIFFKDETRVLSSVIGTFVLPSLDQIEACKLEILMQESCARLLVEGCRLLSFDWKVIPEDIAPMNRHD